MKFVVMNPAHTRTEAQKKRKTKKDPVAVTLKVLVNGAAVITVAVLVLIVGFVLVNGVPHLSWDLFSPEYTSQNVSLMPALINTIIITLLSMVIAVPLGIGSAIYLTEYAKRGNKLVNVIRITAETLSGIPSIVYGLFGFLFFVSTIGKGYSILAGALTLSIMILPTIMRTTEEALISVPDAYREASFGLGAGRLRTIFRVILKSAVPGILSGVILSAGRIVGETAALIYTAGSMAKIPEGLDSSGRTLAVHMYMLSNEGLHMDKAYATAVVLLVIVVGINSLSAFAAKRLTKIK